MSTLRVAVQDYLEMRRSLGFKLHDAGIGLMKFISFLERQNASHITLALALQWTQESSSVQSGNRSHAQTAGLLPTQPIRSELRPAHQIGLPNGQSQMLRTQRLRYAQ